MKKVRFFCILTIVCLCLTGCNTRKAQRGLKDCPFLHTENGAVYDGEQPFTFVSEDIKLSLEAVDTAKESITAAFEKQEVNSARLCLDETWMDEDGAHLLPAAQTMLQKAFELADQYKKYIIINISEYPLAYSAWYEDSSFQSGLVSLWGEIAALCKEERYLAAYELGHVTRPTDDENHKSLYYWEALWQSAADSIRQADSEHILLIGTLSPTVPSDEYGGFPYIKDRNFMYCADMWQFQFYTQQTHLVTEEAIPAHLIYPNAFWLDIQNKTAVDEVNSENISFATMEYQTVVTEPFQAAEDGLYCNIGAYVEPANENGGGELRIRELTLYECDASGKELSTVYRLDSTVGVPFYYLDTNGNNGDASVYEDGTAYLESIDVPTYFFVRDLNIPLEKDKYYKLSVTMKQRGMSSGFKAKACLYIQSCEKHSQFDKQYLTDKMEACFEQANRVGVPILFTGLGVLNDSVTEKKGAGAFLKDATDIVKELGQSYSK